MIKHKLGFKKTFCNLISKNERERWMNIPEGCVMLKCHYDISLLKEMDPMVIFFPNSLFMRVCMCVCRLVWDRLGVLLHRSGRSYSYADLHLVGLLRWQETEAVPILGEIQTALASASALSTEQPRTNASAWTVKSRNTLSPQAWTLSPFLLFQLPDPVIGWMLTWKYLVI